MEGEANKGEERKSRREGTPANKDRLFQVIWRVTLFSSSPKKDGLSAWGSVLVAIAEARSRRAWRAWPWA